MSRSQENVVDVVDAPDAAGTDDVSALRLDKWHSDDSLKEEIIAKWPSNEFVLVPSITMAIRSASPAAEEKMPTAFVRERLSPRTRSLESLTEVSCDVEKQSEVEAASTAVVSRLPKTAVAVSTKKFSPLRNAHFANRPKRSFGLTNLTVLVEDEENDTEPSADRNTLLPSPSNGMQRSCSADLLTRKD